MILNWEPKMPDRLTIWGGVFMNELTREEGWLMLFLTSEEKFILFTYLYNLNEYNEYNN